MQEFIRRFLPIFTWLPNYKRDWLSGDLSAGLTVGVMLIPQGMAYAMLAGLEPIHGLYAVTIPLLLYVIFGTSRQMAVGPAAMVSLLTAAGIASLGPADATAYLRYAVTLAFLVGAIKLTMGVLRLGFIVNFLSHPVLNGFTSAAAVIIGLSQLKHLLRVELPRTEQAYEVAFALFKQLGDTHWLTFGIGVLGILIIKYAKRIHKQMPAPLVAVIVGILLVWGFGLTANGVKIVGEVPSGLPGLSVPSFDLSGWLTLLPIALTIALIGFAESYAVAKAMHARHKDYRLDANQELIGLGMANFGAAFFQGYPVTGGFARTAVNNDAGARSALASIISATLIVLTLLFFTEVFYYLPNAILAAVVLVAVSGLIDYKEPLRLWHKDRSDFFMLMATFVFTLTLGIETGILIGLVLSLVLVIYRASNPHMAELGRVPGTHIFRNLKRFDDLESDPEVLVARVDGPVYFANVAFIESKLDTWVARKGAKLKLIVMSMESVTQLDSTGAHAMHDWISRWRAAGIDVCLSNVKGLVRDVLKRWGLIDYLGSDRLFLDDQAAVQWFQGEKPSQKEAPQALHGKYSTQSNV